MKKITMLSIVAAAMLFVGCGDKSKEAVEEAGKSISTATDKAVAATKEAASKSADAAKEVADEAADKVKEAGASISEATDKAVEATKEAASDATDKVKESAAAATATAATAVAGAATNVAGAAAFAKCAGCHGADGKTKALGKSQVIAGQSKEELITKINGYKAGTLNTAGMGTLMKGQVGSMSDTDIDAVAGYISTLK